MEHEECPTEAFQVWFIIDESRKNGFDDMKSDATLSAVAEAMHVYELRTYSNTIFYIHVLRKIDGYWWCSPTMNIEDLPNMRHGDTSNVLIPTIGGVYEAVLFAKKSAIQHSRMLRSRLREHCIRIDKPWVISISNDLVEDEYCNLGQMIKRDESMGWYGTTRFAFILKNEDRNCDFTMSSHTFRFDDDVSVVFNALYRDMCRDDDMPSPEFKGH